MIDVCAQVCSSGVCIVVERATGNGDDSSGHALVGWMQPMIDALGNVWVAELEATPLRAYLADQSSINEAACVWK